MEGPDHAISAHASPPTARPREPTQRRSLPNGPCNYRDLQVGACGCSQFWDTCSIELHQGSSESRPSSERSTWCVCGHHACFHLQGVPPASFERRSVAAVGALPGPNATCDGRCQLQPGVLCDVHRHALVTDAELPQLHDTQALTSGQSGLSRATHSQHGPQQYISSTRMPTLSLNHSQREQSVQLSPSGFPRVPSVCLTSIDRRLRAEAEARAQQARAATVANHRTATGLGLLLNSTDHQLSGSSTVPDDINRVFNGSFSGSDIPSTRANSVRGNLEPTANLPNGGSLDRILEFNRTLKINTVSDTIPDTCNVEELIQSATEVATPSAQNTPDLGVADQAAQETKKLVETLTKLTAQTGGTDAQDGRPSSAPSASAAALLLANSPSTPQEQLQQALKSASPQAVQKLVSYLAPLHNLLLSLPNMSTSIKELATRLDYLENNSFNHVQPEDVQQQFEFVDGRIIELEHRMDDQEKHQLSVEAAPSNASFDRRRSPLANESFGSNHSCQSTTSSAMILAAIDRKNTETEIDGIKDRLAILESAAMPTPTAPWEVEVVLLPWGTQLHGIWFTHEAPMHDATEATTQDTEEWTQHRRPARDTTSSPASSRGLSSGPGQLSSSFSHGDESAWNSQAISQWASGSADDWLFPKACGSRNLVYKRLQSRGFVRNVTLKSANSRDIQATLSTVFSDLLPFLKHNEEDEDPVVDANPGLQASFIPLRKIVKTSRLQFLAPAEMSSSALWTAQFLSAGVMMRVSGGTRRLYVTQREAYLQHDEGDQALCLYGDESVLGSAARVSGWTWQHLRQLPRFQADPDSQMEGTEEYCQPKVPEADAREVCWAYYELYDFPPAVSANSSFTSHHSAPIELSMRPADRRWRRSMTPSSILKNKYPQPISPLSENHPRPPVLRRSRTFSASIVDEPRLASSKRRLNSSPVKHSSVPQPGSHIVSGNFARLKRRRVAPSSSPNSDANQTGQRDLSAWNQAPERAREPLSPFASSHIGLARSSSDTASRSQRSAGLAGKATPQAYATPYSGPLQSVHGFPGSGNAPGDTEPEDNDDEVSDDDGEQSWRGVDTGNESSASSSSDDDEEVAERSDDHGSLSGDDSGFGTDDDDEVDDNDDDEDDNSEDGQIDPEIFGFGAQRRAESEHDEEDDEEEDGEEIFDTLLGVLRH